MNAKTRAEKKEKLKLRAREREKKGYRSDGKRNLLVWRRRGD